ncbi:MAG: F0F1 ATP synthase subunit B [Mariprofundaceae bacterium]|nr:F0F1 ATP synthase subunit B [Mariprofundaceae bacterium]
MNLNATLIGQILTFILFVWFTMKYVWPPLMKVMEERRAKIADGLAAGAQGQKDLELAQHKSNDMITDAKAQASSIIEQANQRANHIIEESKKDARTEGDRLIKMAQGEIEQETNTARDELLKQVANIAVAGASKILQREVSNEGNDRLVDEVLGEMNG